MHHPSRRALLLASAGTGALAAISGETLYVTNADGSSRYKAALAETRRVDNMDDPRRRMVRFAIMAANSHNTQPWRFVLSERSILVLPDLSRRLAAVDPDNHHLFVSLGCATENIVQCAGALGFAANPVYDPNAGGIRVGLEKAPVRLHGLFTAIPQRQSTRADYDGKSLAPEDLRLLEAAGNGDGVQVRLFTEPKERDDILAWLVAANSAQMADNAFVKELNSWIRFSYSDALLTGDGLFSKCTDNPVLPDWLGRAIFPLVFTKDRENAKYQQQTRSSPGIAVFIGDRNEPAFWAEAGRCCQRFALQATALDIKTAFINQPVEVPAIRGQFAAWLSVGERRPDLMMRFGHGPRLPQSLRRPVGQVIFDA